MSFHKSWCIYVLKGNNVGYDGCDFVGFHDYCYDVIFYLQFNTDDNYKWVTIAKKRNFVKSYLNAC